MMRRVFAVAVVLLSAAPLLAQVGRRVVAAPGWVGPGPIRGGSVGPGAGWSYYGTPNGPTTAYSDVSVGIGVWGWGGYPAAGGAFWTNGLSRYGPAVPTYAPVPGTFGGSDAHRFRSEPPVFGYGLYPLGYRSANLRTSTPNVSVWPEGEPPVLLPAPSTARCARLQVAVPRADADLWVNAKKTTATGAERAFESPDLKDGDTYKYELVARWVENGEPKAESRTVTVSAGQSVLVDFTKEK